MQPQQIIEALKGICDNTTVPAPLRVQSAYGFLMGVATPTTARAQAVKKRPTTAKTAQPARARGRPPNAAKVATAKAPLGELVYALIPETGGGIAQTQIKLRAAKANNIEMALSRLQKAGRLISRGEGKTKTWFRTESGQQALVA